MARLKPAEELDIAIKTIAGDADPHVTSLQLAEEVYESDRKLIEPFIAPWVIQKLAILIGKHRARIRRESQPQLMFEGLLGFKRFKRLPRTIEVEPGKRVRRGEATIGVFRALADRLKKQNNPALEEANNAIALMAKYTPEEPRITWAEVVEREAEKKKGK